MTQREAKLDIFVTDDFGRPFQPDVQLIIDDKSHLPLRAYVSPRREQPEEDQ